jgi:LysM repeat protein
MLAWYVLLAVALVAAAGPGPVRQARVSIRIASSTAEVTAAGSLSVAAAPAAARDPAGYVVQPGDTLAGIAARFAVRGGWPSLYAANRRLIGADPDVIRPGTVLMLPGAAALVRYRVVAGDTLAAIAAGLGVRGGWPSLYAANRALIGPDPGMIRPGMVLALPGSAAPAPGAAGPGGRLVPPGAPGTPAGSAHHRVPVRPGVPAGAGMPDWLRTVLLAAGLLTGAGFLAEPLLMFYRRRRAAWAAAVRSGREPGSGPPGVQGRVVLADYDRLVVTHSRCDDTVYVLRPPGQDPGAILRAARLVLHEGPYRQLAGHLGLPASWPVMLADYDRLVVTHNTGDDTVTVLRPPGQDPETILRAARLVLHEGPYGELADQLGIPGGLPAD